MTKGAAISHGFFYMGMASPPPLPPHNTTSLVCIYTGSGTRDIGASLIYKSTFKISSCCLVRLQFDRNMTSGKIELYIYTIYKIVFKYHALFKKIAVRIKSTFNRLNS